MELTTWGLVLYQNVCSLLIWPVVALFSGEALQLLRMYNAGSEGSSTDLRKVVSTASVVADEEEGASMTSFGTLFPVLVTCVLGAAISFAGWGTRSRLSATSFTVLGVACKIATVGINLVVWQHHSSLVRTCSCPN